MTSSTRSDTVATLPVTEGRMWAQRIIATACSIAMICWLAGLGWATISAVNWLLS
jgi:hypothetical protein